MNAEQWQIAKSILGDALEVEVDLRPVFIRDACKGDDQLESSIRDLLTLADADPDDPLERPAAALLNGEKGRWLGRLVERYRIIGELGSGGMGEVFLAERADGSFAQKVAVKIIGSAFASRESIRRFLVERQILASLNHDNIARLLDGGTTEQDTPFLVMEYVEGQPIIEYANAHQLGLQERLELFLKVCSAVSYAHHNLVIHRDLKPNNILVTGDGVPKLLDFGIAKILSPETTSDMTSTQRLVFTPDYASPEQVLGEKLTTATDVYSLGVILYELLSGRRPYDAPAGRITEIIKVVCDTDPPPPSRRSQRHRELGEDEVRTGVLGERLRGDLDSIVLKALRKTPAHRYQSAAVLANDIRSYLDGKPVGARAGTWRYRSFKFIRRHRVAVAAVFLIVLAVAAGLTAAIQEARIARAERIRAEGRFNDVRQLANSFVFEISDQIEKNPIKARSLLVKRAIEYLDKLASESSGDDGLDGELAAAYEKVGDIQSEIFKPNLGDSGGALESHLKALHLREVLAARYPDDPSRMLDLARSHQKVGSLLTITGDSEGAAKHYQLASQIGNSVLASNPTYIDAGLMLSNSYLLLGQSSLRTGSLTQALEDYQRAMAVVQDIVQRDPSNDRAVARSAVTYSYIGYVEALLGHADVAAAHFRRALEIDQHLLDLDPANRRYQEEVGFDWLWVGYGDREAGDLQKSLEAIQTSIEIQRQRVQADPENMGEKNSLADCLLELGRDYIVEREFGRSLRSFSESGDLYAEVASKDVDNLSAHFQVLVSHRLAADSLAGSGDHSASAKIYAETLPDLRQLHTRDPRNLDWQFELVLCLVGAGESQYELHNREEAASMFRAAVDPLNDLMSRSPANIKYDAAKAELDADLLK